MLQRPNHHWSRVPEGQEKMGSRAQEVGRDAVSFQIVLPAPSLTSQLQGVGREPWCDPHLTLSHLDVLTPLHRFPHETET